jgi:hypothetical protein
MCTEGCGNKVLFLSECISIPTNCNLYCYSAILSSGGSWWKDKGWWNANKTSPDVKNVIKLRIRNDKRSSWFIFLKCTKQQNIMFPRSSSRCELLLSSNVFKIEKKKKDTVLVCGEIQFLSIFMELEMYLPICTIGTIIIKSYPTTILLLWSRFNKYKCMWN